MGTATPFKARNGLDNQSNVIRNIGNESSLSAVSAGAGALRINSNTLQISDGANWNNVGGAGSSLDALSGTSTIASASTTDLSTTNAPDVTVTGSATISSFGALSAGNWRFLTFTGEPTLIHNATSLILPLGIDTRIAIGDKAIAQSLGSGNWRISHFTRASFTPVRMLGKVLASRANYF